MAHELLHSVRPLDKALSNVLLCSVGYMHWTCSHMAHHRNVRPPLLDHDADVEKASMLILVPIRYCASCELCMPLCVLSGLSRGKVPCVCSSVVPQMMPGS